MLLVVKSAWVKNSKQTQRRGNNTIQPGGTQPENQNQGCSEATEKEKKKIDRENYPWRSQDAVILQQMARYQTKTVALAIGHEQRRNIGGGRRISDRTYNTTAEISSVEQEEVSRSVRLLITGI